MLILSALSRNVGILYNEGYIHFPSGPCQIVTASHYRFMLHYVIKEAFSRQMGGCIFVCYLATSSVAQAILHRLSTDLGGGAPVALSTQTATGSIVPFERDCRQL